LGFKPGSAYKFVLQSALMLVCPPEFLTRRS
jgi:hypothetical protein